MLTVMEGGHRYTVVTEPGPQRFAELCWESLQTRPAENNLLGTITQARIRAAPEATAPTSDEHWVRVVDGHRRTVGAAALVPPYATVLFSTMPVAAARAVADHLAGAGAQVAGATGPLDVAAAFAERYAAAAGVPARLTMAQLLFELREVRQPAGIPGRSRLATLDDLELVVAWRLAFEAEALPDATPTEQIREHHRTGATRILTEGRDAWLWEVDGAPVSYVQRARLRPAAGLPATVPLARIGGVYTPPESRGHGYASANVAALSQRCLEEGDQATLLYTDRANPTSNKIYQAVGYQPIGEASTWAFGDNAARR
jgi:predicted GNAT family acetyltransferase